jgi:hypothetical protein
MSFKVGGKGHKGGQRWCSILEGFEDIVGGVEGGVNKNGKEA